MSISKPYVLCYSASEMDTWLIWQAKRKNQDTGSYIDVQLLCGAGYEKTVTYLEQNPDDQAGEQLNYLKQCELYDFVDFSKEEWVSNYKKYYEQP
ncbi:hypothetical protein P5G61_22820 [Paenibacillus sp. F6_3S_P_1C]|uniref:Uncharacterized protein n=1 Tax=Paenibacillus vandeheii TaxID=3035917 RepID=A0ABT8JGY3_9BACL|nr:hypothetical protein [Paenibacillus vandeheii]MDN4604093.1 hypothetical protein [Paenibacillus vandeheii]